jgi:hypothetical protein
MVVLSWFATNSIRGAFLFFRFIVVNPVPVAARRNAPTRNGLRECQGGRTNGVITRLRFSGISVRPLQMRRARSLLTQEKGPVSFLTATPIWGEGAPVVPLGSKPAVRLASFFILFHDRLASSSK